MQPIVVIYGTREGHTQKIALNIAASLANHGLQTLVKDAREAESLDLSGYSGAILAASVHRGKHEPEVVRFVKQHRAELDAKPNAFLSVTLSEAAVEDGADRTHQSPQELERARADVGRVIDEFLVETGWRPQRVKAVAGALPYSKYNPLLRLAMKWIAKSQGGDTDTSRDYEYTDWAALDRFVGEYAQEAFPKTKITSAT